MAFDGFTYVPSEWQQRYHALFHNEALGAGSAGPGKTTCLKFEPLQQFRIEHARCARDPTLVASSEDDPLWRLVEENPLEWGMSKGWALYLRRARPHFEQMLDQMKRIIPLIDSGARWNADYNYFTLSSGMKYQLGHCYNRRDWEQYDSNEYTIIMFDELVQFLEEQYTMISSRARTDDPVLRPMVKVRAMSNPNTGVTGDIVLDDPEWVKRYFVDPAPEGNVTLVKKVTRGDGSVVERTRIYLPARLHDNPNKDFVLAEEAKMLALPKHIRKARLDGDWDATEGAFFGDAWEPGAHICEPFSVPTYWGIFRSCDWGYVSPGIVHWFAIDPDSGDLFVTAEFGFRGKHAARVGNEVVSLETRMGLADGKRSYITGPADTQLWEERGETTLRKIDEFARAGCPWVQANKKAGSRRRNAELVVQRLQGLNDRGGEGPRVRIFRTCKNLIAVLPRIPTDPHDNTVPKKGGNDHAYDSFSYGVWYAATHKIASLEQRRRPPRVSERSVRAGTKGDRTGYGTPT